jgi:DNA-binding transcriptional LysR family regulator
MWLSFVGGSDVGKNAGQRAEERATFAFMQKLRWDDARVLLALLQARSLSGAGARLGVNASTVSRRLEALEAALGAHLFDRTPDGVLATAAAEALGPHAEAMERAANGLALAAQGREVAPEGEVRLTAPPGLVEFLLAPALPRLLRRHPGLRLHVDASVGYADLTRREADLALRMARPTTGDLVVKRLGELGGGVFAAGAYAAELGTLRRLEQARWITWGDDLAHLLAARVVAERVPAAQIVLRTSHMGAQLGAARAGVGAVLADPQSAHRAGLVEVPLAPALRRALPPMRGGELWLAVHRALRELPRIAAVWSFLEEMAAEAGIAGSEARPHVGCRDDAGDALGPAEELGEVLLRRTGGGRGRRRLHGGGARGEQDGEGGRGRGGVQGSHGERL